MTDSTRTDLAEIIRDAAYAIGASNRTHYSGRTTHDGQAPCVAVVLDSQSDLVALGMSIAHVISGYTSGDAAPEDIAEAINTPHVSRPCVDVISQGIVVYWPSIVEED